MTVRYFSSLSASASAACFPLGDVVDEHHARRAAEELERIRVDLDEQDAASLGAVLRDDAQARATHARCSSSSSRWACAEGGRMSRMDIARNSSRDQP